MYDPLTPKHSWTREEIAELYALPLDVLFGRALEVKRANWPDGAVQVSQLMNIKTGGCAEDCGYCSQSAHHETGLKAEKLAALGEVVAAAREAKAGGADRFCMGAAWRELKDRDLPKVVAMVEAVRAEGLETCMTLGMLEPHQADALAEAGLDYYNHNLDTSPEYYGEVVSTRTYQDRIDTLGHARRSGMKLCCGGILGMGESREDRIGLIHELAKLSPHPESVPINQLVPIAGTPLGDSAPISPVELARAIAVCRIVFPRSWVRLSAGRQELGEAGQALCFLAGANSIFSGDKLLTTSNPGESADSAMLALLAAAPAPREAMEAHGHRRPEPRAKARLI